MCFKESDFLLINLVEVMEYLSLIIIKSDNNFSSFDIYPLSDEAVTN